MRWTTLLRAGAILLAIVAAIDPSWTSQQKSPLPIAIRAAEPSDESTAEAVRQRMRSMNDVAMDGSEDVRAVVLVGKAVRPWATLPEVPISVVTRPDGPDVVVEDVEVPPVLLAGLTAAIQGTVSSTGMAGRTSSIALEYQGIELAVVEHRWTADNETFRAQFEHVPPAAGAGTVRIAVKPLDREVSTGDNHAEAQVIVEDRKLRVLVHEPRPSWATTFIRRVLEQEPVFEVAALTRPSRGVFARAGSPPERLSAGALERFDVVIAGAPEELREDELEALSAFSQRRGGTVVLVPDRRPSGPYVRHMPIARFDEALVQSPVSLEGINPAGMKGSEFVTIVEPGAGVETLASLPRQKGPALSERGDSKGSVPVIVSWPSGAGRTIFSGALDAWRYRSVDGAFAGFWKARIAHAAAQGPRALEIELDPAPVSPGDIVRVRARLRATEYASRGGAIEFPPVAGRVVAAGSISAERPAFAPGAPAGKPAPSAESPVVSSFPVRLWPAGEVGVFEGRFAAPAAGRHVVEISAAAVSASKPLIVSTGSRPARRGSRESLHQLASATGGVVVSATDLSPLETFVAGIPRPSIARNTHPARSAVWGLAFIALLSAEWWLRRRQGHA